MIKLDMKIIKLIYIYVLKDDDTIRISNDKWIITDDFGFEWEYSGNKNAPYFKAHEVIT